jgi:GNAT superfamily N-acetyltransferase
VLTTTTRVRPAREGDGAQILALIRELADYERAPDAVVATEGDLQAALFGPDPRVHALVAEVVDVRPAQGEPTAAEAAPAETAGEQAPGEQTPGEQAPGEQTRAEAAPAGPTPGEPAAELAGMAVWFVSFSTWRGKHGIWLEDLFVRPAYRGLGLGQALLAELAAECVRRGWTRLEWNVLDWNEPALGFYGRLGAQSLTEWTVHRLADGPLDELAATAGAWVHPAAFANGADERAARRRPPLADEPGRLMSSTSRPTRGTAAPTTPRGFRT